VVYSNDGPAGDEDGGVERPVWVPKGVKVRATDNYRGRLVVYHYASAVGTDGSAFPAFVEVRAVLDRGVASRLLPFGVSENTSASRPPTAATNPEHRRP
jgi:hypothetical protein